MKNKSFKRILSIILALVLTLGMLVVPAYAEDDNELEIISSVCVTAVTPTTISVKKINNVYYSLDNTTDWTTDATFYGLYPNTQHKVYYRFGTTGTPKELATVTTKESESRTDDTLIDSNALSLGSNGYSTSFELKNDLTYRLYLKAANYDNNGYTNLHILVERKKYDTTAKNYVWESTILYPLKDKVNIGGSLRYEFVYQNMASCEINDQLNITLYADKGGKTYISTIFTTSMVQTAKSLYSPNDAALNKLVADFLNYGAASQLYFGYNTANLANADMGALASYASTTDPELKKAPGFLTDNPDAPAYISGFSLAAGNKISLNIRSTFTGVNSSQTLLKLNLNNLTHQYKYSSVGFYSIDDIPAPDFGTVFEFAIYQGNTLISDRVATSIESCALSYINSINKLANPTQDELALLNLYKAMMKYSHSAAAYFL